MVRIFDHDENSLLPYCVVMGLPRGETASDKMFNRDFGLRPVLLVPGTGALQQ